MPDREDEVTYDSLLRGRVKLIQPARGFRSSLDPVLLAGFVEPPYGHFLDIGAGTGAVSFLLLAADQQATGEGVEIQSRLAGLTAQASIENGFASRFRLHTGDVRALPLPAAAYDLVVSNPPFRQLGQGPLPPDEERARAHHEVTLALDEWLDVATRVLRPDGRLAVIHAAGRLPELLGGMLVRGLSPVRLRAVHPQADAPATRVLVEARRATGRPLVVCPPLFVHEAGRYSAEVRRYLGEGP